MGSRLDHSEGAANTQPPSTIENGHATMVLQKKVCQGLGQMRVKAMTQMVQAGQPHSRSDSRLFEQPVSFLSLSPYKHASEMRGKWEWLKDWHASESSAGSFATWG
jgi:hypothetical protein